jgi:hypothetical protein
LGDKIKHFRQITFGYGLNLFSVWYTLWHALHERYKNLKECPTDSTEPDAALEAASSISARCPLTSLVIAA